jgi:hypothetical protein
MFFINNHCRMLMNDCIDINIFFLLGKMYQTTLQQIRMMINLIVLFSMIHVFVMLLNSIQQQQHLLVLFFQKLV